VSEYFVPVVAPGREVVVMANPCDVPEVIVSVALPDFVESALLVAVTVAF
jgi:hypothetical protein